MCAKLVKNVHLSGGVGIGGVLEPLQANPTIIGDNCFIGARSEVVEGVIVEDGCVILWAYLSVNQRRSMIVKLVKCSMVAFLLVLWLFQVAFHQNVVNTAYTVQ